MWDSGKGAFIWQKKKEVSNAQGGGGHGGKK